MSDKPTVCIVLPYKVAKDLQHTLSNLYSLDSLKIVEDVLTDILNDDTEQPTKSIRNAKHFLQKFYERVVCVETYKQLLDEAVKLAKVEYDMDLEIASETIKGMIKSRDITTWEEFCDQVFEYIGGTSRISDDREALATLLVSPNDSEAWEHGGGDSWTALAFYPFQQDIFDYMKRNEGIDHNYFDNLPNGEKEASDEEAEEFDEEGESDEEDESEEEFNESNNPSPKD